MDSNNIDREAHYFILMHPLEGIVTPYGPIIYTSSSTREKWVECAIVEENYKLSEDYKIELRSVEPGYGKEAYYMEDFFSLQERGYIVKKEPGMECVEEKWIEPLTDIVNLHHSAYTLKLVNKKGKTR